MECFPRRINPRSAGYTDRSSREPRGRMRPGVKPPGGTRAIGAVAGAGSRGWLPTARTGCTGPGSPGPICDTGMENAASEPRDNMLAIIGPGH